jgi:hypothetical protein
VNVKSYQLRKTLDNPFRLANGVKWHSKTCSVCGHHVPMDQHIDVEGDIVHNDVRICLALTKKRGNKL